jgi:tetratricopeptide (TPR) repeat protein
MPSWEAPARARELVERWLEPRSRGRRIVTITLREASYYTARNSNVSLWTDFARRLDPQRYFVVFVRDTEKAFEPIADTQGPFETFPTASVDLAVRAALYAASFLSMMSSTGPIMLLFFNPDCHGVICDLLNPKEANSSAAALRSLGLEIGLHAPLLGVTKRFLWEPATVELLFRAFGEAVGLIEGGPERAAAQTASETEPPLRLARRLRETGRYDAARRIYANELTKRPWSAAAFCGLSLVALDVSLPNYGRWRQLRTSIFYRRRKLIGAYYFARAWHAGLGRWQSRDEGIEIALCLEKWRRRPAALAIYHAILSQDPTEPTAHYRLALDARDRGERERAMRELAHAIVSDPYSGRYHLALAELHDVGGQTEIAAKHYALAAACEPSIVARPGTQTATSPAS